MAASTSPRSSPTDTHAELSEEQRRQAAVSAARMVAATLGRQR